MLVDQEYEEKKAAHFDKIEAQQCV